MTITELQTIAEEFVKTSPLNRVSAEKALREDLVGMPLLDAPIFGVAAADDAYLLGLQDSPEANLKMDPPTFWLPNAKTVISFFIPFTGQVKQSNRLDPRQPSKEYLHSRIDGQTFIIALCGHLQQAIQQAGFSAVIPATDPRFWSNAATDKKGVGMLFTSNWSERHAAYAAGLGTFALHRTLITRVGSAGRVGSLITDLELPVTPRPYTGLTDYCTMCGACAVRCPAGAISLENGKQHPPCSEYLDGIRAVNAPYYGCGKCQSSVPCENRIPGIKA